MSRHRVIWEDGKEALATSRFLGEHRIALTFDHEPDEEYEFVRENRESLWYEINNLGGMGARVIVWS